MVSYLNKLLWQSKRRKSVDISTSRQTTPRRGEAKEGPMANEEDQNNSKQLNSQTVATTGDLDVSIKSIKSTERTAITTTITSTTTNSEENDKNRINKQNLKHTNNAVQMNKQQELSRHIMKQARLNLASPGQVLYVVSVALVAFLCTAGRSATCHQSDARRVDNTNNNKNNFFINQQAKPFVSTIDWHRVASKLAHQLSQSGLGAAPVAGPVGWPSLPGSSRWSYGPNDHETRDSYRYPARRQGYLVRTLNRIRSRMGARNSIRVHNAFRDMAWQLLSRLSMPTPVIYELRRQHLYSPDEDLMNDSLFNKNTTRTIRTKRLLDNLLDNWHYNNNNNNKAPSNQKKLTNRADRDEDDEPEGFRERLRMRLDELVNLSRRSLFGRVIRVPSIFPFKRHEEANNTNSAKQKPAGKSSASSRRRNQRFSVVRRKKKEADRQMIQINGKQYYVDEEGELKELKDPVVV